MAVAMHKNQQMDDKQIAEVSKLSEPRTQSSLFSPYETLREQLEEFVKKFVSKEGNGHECKDIRESTRDSAAASSAATPEVHDDIDSCAGRTEKSERVCQTMALLDERQAPSPAPYFDMRLHARLREEAAKQPAGGCTGFEAAFALSLALVMAGGRDVASRTMAASRRRTFSGSGIGTPWEILKRSTIAMI